jgi:hypothetical protein
MNSPAHPSADKARRVISMPARALSFRISQKSPLAPFGKQIPPPPPFGKGGNGGILTTALKGLVESAVL